MPRFRLKTPAQRASQSIFFFFLSFPQIVLVLSNSIENYWDIVQKCRNSMGQTDRWGVLPIGHFGASVGLCPMSDASIHH